MIVILDYGAGNVHSIQHACKSLGYTTVLSNSIDDVRSASKLIIPGQGAFTQAMSNLNKLHLVPEIKSLVTRAVPILGICLGFQILFETSTEHHGGKGLEIIPGHVTKIKSTSLKIPHMGWNQCLNQHPLMYKDIKKDSYFYFVHSYCVEITSSEYIASTTDYGTHFVSSVVKDAVWGTQFHPEKSSENGLQLLKNFLLL